MLMGGAVLHLNAALCAPEHLGPYRLHIHVRRSTADCSHALGRGLFLPFELIVLTILPLFLPRTATSLPPHHMLHPIDVSHLVTIDIS